jgi:acetyl esterase/lipase
MMAAVFIIAIALPTFRTHRLSRVGAGAATLAFVIALTPYARVPGAVRDFDHTFASTLGDSTAHATLSLRTLLLGVPLGEAKITRGIPIAAPDGVPLTMNVYQPVARGHYPILVQIYGGAWMRGTPDSFKNFAQWLASRGFVVFAIDYRHAPAAHWPAQLDDTRLMLAWIRDHAIDYDGDTARVAYMGRSAGAHLATIAAWSDVPPPLPPKAIVSYYGPVNLTESYKHPPVPDPIKVRETDEALIGGTLDQFPAAFADASPITHVAKATVPTLLIYGRRDHIVQPAAGHLIRDGLNAAGVKTVYLEIPWADHGFDEVFQGPSNQLALYYTERFLRNVLRPE